MFLACYADNLTDFDLRSLVQTHRGTAAIATLTVFHSERSSAGGVVELDADGTVVGFTEKPSQPVSDTVNAGCMPSIRAYSMRSAARRRVISAMTSCLGWWAGRRRCRWKATSAMWER